MEAGSGEEVTNEISTNISIDDSSNGITISDNTETPDLAKLYELQRLNLKIKNKELKLRIRELEIELRRSNDSNNSSSDDKRIASAWIYDNPPENNESTFEYYTRYDCYHNIVISKEEFDKLVTRAGHQKYQITEYYYLRCSSKEIL